MRFEQVLDILRAVGQRDHDIDIARVFLRRRNRLPQAAERLVVTFTARDGRFHGRDRRVHRFGPVFRPIRQIGKKLAQCLDMEERHIDLVV